MRVKPQQYNVGDWVYYYNPRRHAGRQDKWRRKFDGPYLVVKVLGPVNVLLQRSKRTKPFNTHIDKVKPYTANTPKSWLGNDNSAADELKVSSGVTETSVALRPQHTSSVQQDGHPATSEEANDSQLTAIAGVPAVHFESPRPKRNVGRPRRYDD